MSINPKNSYKKVRPPKINGILKVSENLTCGGVEIILNEDFEVTQKLSYNGEGVDVVQN